VYFGAKTTSKGKKINYKVVDLVDTYNFCTYHFFHPRPFEFFKNPPLFVISTGKDVRRRYPYRFVTPTGRDTSGISTGWLYASRERVFPSGSNLTGREEGVGKPCSIALL